MTVVVPLVTTAWSDICPKIYLEPSSLYECIDMDSFIFENAIII